MSHIMAAPYGRIIFLHITILFGGMLVQFLGNPIWALIMLIVLKIGYDVGKLDPIKKWKQKNTT